MYVIESFISPAVYWYYIGAQYFPSSMWTSKKKWGDISNDLITEARKIVSNQSPLTIESLGSTANFLMSKDYPEMRSKPKEDIIAKKMTLETDQLIQYVSKEKEKAQQSVESILKTIGSRFDMAISAVPEPDSDSIQLKSIAMSSYDETIYWTYTRKSKEELEKQLVLSQNNEKDLLLELRTFTKADIDYVETMKQRACKKGIPSEGTNSHRSRSRMQRKKNQQRGKLQKKGSKAETSNSSLKGEEQIDEKPLMQNNSKKTSFAVSGHRINTYIKNSVKNANRVNDEVCQVCNDGDYEEDNKIVFCAVHSFIHFIRDVIYQYIRNVMGFLNCQRMTGYVKYAENLDQSKENY